MKKKIAIIGAGIGGLTLANLLQKNSDFEFMIYEKEETLNLKEGFGIQLGVNSVSILNLRKNLNKSKELNQREKIIIYFAILIKQKIK